MTQVRVNSVAGISSTPVTLGYGATITTGYSISGSGGANVIGIITASSFVGDGSNLTGIDAVSLSKAIALTILS